ncbi:exostosin-3 [Parasteatoda tepidariorum]|uniref:exostosin-3 n=1 Tax=Parasteatoda tepidariorum TaxID=114398 RepID=UPI00077FB8E3|nr:exostosin-3 [Parasteatoda tepidariorum]XP_042902882.1 exostosin-3 [Parasteatoda tepidariorum]
MALLDSSSGYLTFFRHIHYRMPSVRFSKIIILNLFILFVVITFLAHYYLPKIGNDDPVAEIHQKGMQMEDLDSIKAIDLKSRIEEMIRIKVSVSNELRELESRRQKLQSDISILTQRMEDLKVDYSRQQVDLDRLRISVEQAQYAQKEVQEKNTPFIGAPKRILPSLDDNIHMPPSTLKGIRNCKNFLCFDYSRCSLTSGFPVYFYQPEDFGTWNSKDHYLRSAVMEALNVNIHITFDPSIACIFVVLVGEIVHGKKDPKSLEHYLSSLNYWNGNGRNHILFNLVSETNETNNVFAGLNTGRAIVVQSHFTTKDFRPHFDIISPPLFYKKDKISKLYLYSPARRKFLLSYQGEYRTSSYVLKSNFRKLSTATLSDEVNGMENAKMTDSQSEDVENLIVNILKEMQLSALGDNFFFQFSCAGSSSPGYDSEWLMCGTHETRLEVLQDSTFSLLVSPSDYNIISTPQIHVRLIEALQTGAVPVVLGDHVHLPFDEVVDWRRAAVILPKARVSELHYYLRTISDSDIIAMRHQGRLLWEHYLAGPRQVVATILSIIRNRIQIPAPACREESSPSVFNETFRPLKAEFAAIQDPDPEENLGPVESPFPSLSFRRNLTIANSKTYFVWNEQFDPFILYPHTPFDPVLPSESKFIGSSFGFRPIGQGAGGSGKEFSEALGGNYPREQFTIVILTYEREAVLIDSLQRLRGLPYLNKVVVVWNSEKLPSADLRWPEIGVPIHVIKAKKNSLNNRFLPFDVIETEAVLSVDDDAHLRHDEIVFGFRVWREARDRIVGFPGRYHAWYSLNGGWHYNSNYSCELSMVLTGAAFFHKYYTYLYSYSMPQVIRDKVDEYMNCEDIAMNFLVSHVTRKPPIKVTSRWTFRCPGCPVSLSEEDSHFQERHRCIDFFSQVYGYMPLLNTQFRADSVLFKTRIPHDKQKCFKFI